MSNALANFVIDAFKALEASTDESGGGTVSPETRTQPLSESEQPGATIGRYQLLERLGEGGFGTVWKAEQSRPVRRQVALKIVKLGMDTREVIARFEAERQALARLDHPNIAKVFDAGATPTGRPYFVMELVRGEPITRHCAREKLPLRERLELFIEVCRAVQHAHQKGIIHRDLKPSNLLVSLVDGKSVPKVIDFGIAKATGGERLTELSFVTRADRLIGTPAYMSPEQSQASAVDTRTDIYSLGVVLYELLAGEVPYKPGPDGRLQRDHTAQRPSTRLRSLTADQLASVAETRRLEGPKLIGQVKGDLDWIVMKAIEEEPARRYESAIALAEDLRRFLAREPVGARPPTTWYLARRFTERHRFGVAAAAAIVLALVAGITVSTWMYFQEKRALVRSEQVSKFLKQVLAQAGPLKAQGQDATMMRHILDQTAGRIGKELADQPEVQADLRSVVAETYGMLEEYPSELAQSTEALRLLRLSHHGDETLANALYYQSRSLMGVKRWKEAVDAATEALAIRQRVYGENHLLTATIRGEMAWALMELGRTAEAEKSARMAMAVWRKLPDQTILLGAPRSLSFILHREKRYQEAIAVLREELAAERKALGPESYQMVNTLDNLGFQLLDVNGDQEAEGLLSEALRQSRKFLPRYDSGRAHIYRSLLRIAGRRNDWEGQLSLARRFIAESKSAIPPEPREIRSACAVLAGALLEQAERFAKSEPSRALAMLGELEGSKDFEPDVKSARGWIDCLRGLALRADPAKRDEASALLERGLEAMKKKEKPTAEEAQRIKKLEALVKE